MAIHKTTYLHVAANLSPTPDSYFDDHKVWIEHITNFSKNALIGATLEQQNTLVKEADRDASSKNLAEEPNRLARA